MIPHCYFLFRVFFLCVCECVCAHPFYVKNESQICSGEGKVSNKTDRSDKCPEVAHKHTHDTSEEHAQTVSRKLILIHNLFFLQ